MAVKSATTAGRAPVCVLTVETDVGTALSGLWLCACENWFEPNDFSSLPCATGADEAGESIDVLAESKVEAVSSMRSFSIGVDSLLGVTTCRLSVLVERKGAAQETYLPSRQIWPD